MKDIDRVAAELASSQHGVFRRRQVLALAGSPSACDRRLDSGIALIGRGLAAA